MIFKKVLGLCGLGVLTCGGLLANVNILNSSFFENPVVGTNTYAAFEYLGGTTTTIGRISGDLVLLAMGVVSRAEITPRPDGTQVLFLQNISSASQTLSGFQNGVTYTLSFDLGFRQNYGIPSQGAPPQQVLQVTLDGQTLFSGLPWANTPAYTLETVSFTATPESHTLTFAGLNSGDGAHDSTDFVDNVHLIRHSRTRVVRASGSRLGRSRDRRQPPQEGLQSVAFLQSKLRNREPAAMRCGLFSFAGGDS